MNLQIKTDASTDTVPPFSKTDSFADVSSVCAVSLKLALSFYSH